MHTISETVLESKWVFYVMYYRGAILLLHCALFPIRLHQSMPSAMKDASSVMPFICQRTKMTLLTIIWTPSLSSYPTSQLVPDTMPGGVQYIDTNVSVGPGQLVAAYNLITWLLAPPPSLVTHLW